MAVHLPLSVRRLSRSRSRKTLYSAEWFASSGGTTPAFSNWAPRSTSMVASPPSSRIMLAGSPGQVSICSAAHQYSSRVSPFQANTDTPFGSSTVPCGPTTTAAAAWSWVEKMLQLAQRTSAPRATRVSMSTAVCTVMCSEPEMRAPFSGCTSAYSRRRAIRPGISCSASRISLRPKSARARSATLKSMPLRTSAVGVVRAGSSEVVICLSWFGCTAARLAPPGGRVAPHLHTRPPSSRRSDEHAVLGQDLGAFAGRDIGAGDVATVVGEQPLIHHRPPQRRHGGEQNHGRVARGQLRSDIGAAQGLVSPAGACVMIAVTLQMEQEDVGHQPVAVPAVARRAARPAAVRAPLAQQPVVLDVVDRLQQADADHGLDQQPRQDVPAEDQHEPAEQADRHRPRLQDVVVHRPPAETEPGQPVAFQADGGAEAADHAAWHELPQRLAHPGAGRIVGGGNPHVVTAVVLDEEVAVAGLGERDLGQPRSEEHT